MSISTNHIDYENFISSTNNVKNFIVYVFDNDLLCNNYFVAFFTKLFNNISMTSSCSFYEYVQKFMKNYDCRDMVFIYAHSNDNTPTITSKDTRCELCNQPIFRTKNKCKCNEFSNMDGDLPKKYSTDPFIYEVLLSPTNIRQYLLNLFNIPLVVFSYGIYCVIQDYCKDKIMTPFYKHIGDTLLRYGLYKWNVRDVENKKYHCFSILLQYNYFKRIASMIDKRKYLLMLFHEECNNNYDNGNVSHRVFADSYLVKCMSKFF